MMKFLNKKRKLGNKGFSLVELIIVIAIMAVLVAVLAPQYLKYVEKSRVSKDDANANQLLTAVQVAMTDETIAAAVAQLAADPTIVMATTGTTSTDATTGALINAELTSTVGGWATISVTSNTYSNDATHDVYTITIDRATAVATGAWG